MINPVYSSVLLVFWMTSACAQNPSSLPEEILVEGERLYFSQSNTPAPILVYQEEFFQSFEPQSVGDMLKRVSGVAFSSDIGEFEAPQLRGLAPQYTQVLINGQRIAGVSDDRVALVDRIPAALIERIEVIRSSSAAIDSQGLGGTLNLILKDRVENEGGEWRLGGLYYGDINPSLNGTGSVTLSNQQNNWNSLLAVNIQERQGPKTKTELGFDDEDNFLQQFISDDVRESTDSSLFGNVTYELEHEEKLNLRIALIESQIDEIENFQLLDRDFLLDEEGLEQRDSDQIRMDVGLTYENTMSESTQYRFTLSGSRFNSDTLEIESLLQAADFETQLDQRTEIEDLDLQIASDISYKLNQSHQMNFGIGANRQDREAIQIIFEREDDEFVNVTPENTNYKIEEIRKFLYLKDHWSLSANETIEFGLRAEDTEITQRGSAGLSRDSQFELNPSFHYLRNIGSQGQLRLGLARTLRRPNFAEIIPFINQDTPNEDQVTIGNPLLTPEVALGADLGLSFNFSGGGILGLNLFYRDIEDKIELTQIDSNSYTPKNIGNGKTWGIELDYGVPIKLFGEPVVSLFSNLTFLESEIEDPFTGRERRFNLQPHFIGNIDLVHSVPQLNLSHGFSFQKQSSIRESQFDETKRVSYGTNLEYFLERGVSDNLVVRFSVSNALDARKRETGLIYDGLSSRLEGEFDERFSEIEQAEPVFLLTIRGTF